MNEQKQVIGKIEFLKTLDVKSHIGKPCKVVDVNYWVTIDGGYSPYIKVKYNTPFQVEGSEKIFRIAYIFGEELKKYETLLQDKKKW